MSVAMSFPAINGEVVTQGHADYCAEHGHASHTVGTDVSPNCPRCGSSRIVVTVPEGQGCYIQEATVVTPGDSAPDAVDRALTILDRHAALRDLIVSIDTYTVTAGERHLYTVTVGAAETGPRIA